MGILSEELKMFIDNNKIELSEAKTVNQTLLNSVMAMGIHIRDAEKILKSGDMKGGYKKLGEIMYDISTAMYNSGRKSLAMDIDRVRDKMLKAEESEDFEDMMRD